jgi:hypothetical protein
MLGGHLHHCVVESLERGDPAVLDELVELYELSTADRRAQSGARSYQ